MNADKLLTVATVATIAAVLYSTVMIALWIISVFATLVKVTFIGLIVYGFCVVVFHLAREFRSDKTLESQWD